MRDPAREPADGLLPVRLPQLALEPLTSVTSRAISDEPTQAPFASRIGEIATDTATGVPSFRRCVVWPGPLSDAGTVARISGSRIAIGLPIASAALQP